MDWSTVGFNNQLYSEQEQHNIRRLRQFCTKRLQVVRDEMRLRCEAERLEVEIQRLDIALAPHTKLPLEILRRIFELCCEEPAQIPVQNGSIYTISHVCSLWREIALSTPEFWANVSIKIKAPNEHQLQVAEQWLSRAGSHPGSLNVMDTNHYATDVTLGRRLLHNLIIHHPCRELRLSLPHFQVTPRNELLNGPLSGYLEVLDINQCSQTVWGSSPDLFAPTTRLTKLRHFRLVGDWDFKFPNIMAVIPWNQLQYLTLLLWIPYSHCLDLLSECTSLVRCRMSVDYSPAARRPITLPALRVLRLFFRPKPEIVPLDCAAEEMIQFLSVPRLSHLTLGHKELSPGIQPSTYLVRIGAPEIYELLQRSNGMPDLVSLDLGLITSTPIDMGALLKNMPQLRLLHVRSGIFGEEVRNGIATGTLAPQLRSIMTKVRHEAIDILQMVELRHQKASMALIDNTKQVAEFSSITFSCHLHTLNTQQYLVVQRRLTSLEEAAPRLSINL